MKSFLLSISLIILITTNCNAQKNNTCESKETTFIELNTLSLNKCDIDASETNTRKIINNISKKKKNNRIAHYIRKTPKPISETKKQHIKSSIHKEVLFSVVDELPLFKRCNNVKDKSCFYNEFYLHFSKNFNPENASNDGINGRVFVQFTINIKGEVVNILVNGPKKAINLKKEIKRVIGKLPIFTPALHKGFPVNVTHSLPLNLTSN